MNQQREASAPESLKHRDNLDAIEKETWELLVRAVTARGFGWRLPVIATRSSSGVRQRTVVLRDADSEKRVLLAHTDFRSPKIAQIRADDRVSLLFYDSSLAVQLSVTATAVIHTADQTADRIWDASHPLSLKYCLGPEAPGTESGTPTVNLPKEWIQNQPTKEDLQDARARFAVLEFTVRQIDWLSLSRDGNLRAEFSYTPDHPEAVTRQWLAP